MSKGIRQPGPPLAERSEGLPRLLEEALRRSEDKLRELAGRLKDAEGTSSPRRRG
jgi:hypothetical protein